LGNTGKTHSLLVQCQDLVVSRLATIVDRGGHARISDESDRRCDQADVRDARSWRTGWLKCGLIVLKRRLSRRVQRPSLPSDDALHHVRQILQHMKAIDNLYGSRRAPARTFGIRAGPIAGNDLDGQVPSQPGRESICGAIRQQIDDLVCFEIDQDGSEGVPLPV
jgi:hypothetical protein